MRYADLKCLGCGREITSSGPAAWDDSPPDEALVFTAGGNYGSTVYDPDHSSARRENLTVIICDGCITKAAESGNVMHASIIRYEAPRWQRQPWKSPASS